MIVRLQTEPHLEFLSVKGGYIGSSESTLVKMPHCWKSHVTAHYSFLSQGPSHCGEGLNMTEISSTSIQTKCY